MKNKKIELKGNNKIEGKLKAVLSLFLAGVAAVTFTACGNNDTKSTDENTTSISEESKENPVRVGLWADFNINDDNEVERVAKEIYAKSNKSVSVFTIKNLIYLINEKFDKINFDKIKNPEKKFMYIQKLITTELYELLSSDVEFLSGAAVDAYDGNKADTNFNLIHSYMLVATKDKTCEDVYNAINNQILSIKQGNTSAFDKNSNNFLSVYNNVCNANLSDGKKLTYELDMWAKSVAFINQKELANYTGNPANALLVNATKNINYDVNKLEECNPKKSKEGNYNLDGTPRSGGSSGSGSKKSGSRSGGSGSKGSGSYEKREGGNVISTTEEEVTFDVPTGKHEDVCKGGKEVSEKVEIEEGTTSSYSSDSFDEYEEVARVYVDGEAYIIEAPTKTIIGNRFYIH